MDRKYSRLDFAIKNAEDANDLDAWLIAVRARYARTKAGGSSQQELAAIRRSLRDRVDPFRARFRSQVGRLWASQTTEQMIGELFRDELGRAAWNPDEIFNMIESTKSRVLLDHMHLGFQNLARPEQRERVSELECKMLSFPEDEDEDPLRFEIRLASVLPIGSRWEVTEHAQWLREIELAYSRENAGFTGSQPVAALSDIRSTLGAREALIECFSPRHPLHPAMDLYLMAITKDGVFWAESPLPQRGSSGFVGTLMADGKQPLAFSPLGELVVTARSRVQNGNDAAGYAALRQLYQLLIMPLTKAGIRPQAFERWIIVPHGMLHSVPWAALMTPEDRCLIEDVALTFVPSASVWLKLEKQGRNKPKTFLALANPTLPYTGLPRLPQAEVEVQTITEQHLKALTCVVLKAGQATETALRQQLQGKDIVHLATHGEFPQQNPLNFHSVLLSPTYKHDGRVTAEKLREMNFSGAKLVVLSICNGGIYRFGPGDEPYGLTSALLSGSAQNLIGTLWPIEDEKGREYIVELYRFLLESGPAEAIRKTTCELIKQKNPISEWAAFLCVGGGGPFQA